MRKSQFSVVTAIVLLGFSNASFGQMAPDLGWASTFTLFTSGGAFNGNPGTTVIGDIGTAAGAYTPPGTLVGTAHVADPVSVLAAADLATAFMALDANNTCAIVLGTPFGNQTLSPNVYCLGGASVLTGNLILDAGGNPNAVFVFKVGGALTTNTLSAITLINGANFCNVYFWVDGAVNLGPNSGFQGNILAAGAIGFQTGAVLNGRALTTMGAISTLNNTVNIGACAVVSPPIITCPADVTVSCASQVPAANPASVTTVSTCPGIVTVISLGDVISNQTCTNRFTVSRTYQATDNCGNVVTCTQTITVNDQTAPTINCPANVAVACGGQVPQGSNTAAATSDNCGGPVTVTFNDVISNQSCPNRYILTRTYTGTDACGNAGTCDQIITVNDQTPPTIMCPSQVSVSCVPPADPASVTTSDNCPGAVTVTSSDALSNQRCVNGLTITRTYTATDVCGNAAMCNQTITVNDVTPPTVVTGIIAACYPSVAAAEAAALLATTGTDNCGGAVTKTVATVGTCSATITVTVTDGCGNAAMAVYNTRIDGTPPTVVTGTIAACFPSVAAAEAAAILATTETDNCPGPLTEVAATIGTCAATITVTVTDGCGNMGVATYSTRIDGTPPTVVTGTIAACFPSVAAAETAALLATTATDNCPGALTKTVATVTATNVACGVNITVTVTDGCGNAAIAVYSTRIDATAPTIVTGTIAACFPSVAAAEAAAILATTETDNCPGPLTEVAATVGTCSATITVTVMDGCGNTGIAIYMTRIDGTAPTVVTGTIAACFPSVAAAETAALLATTATDNCPGALTIVATTVAATNVACGFTITVTVTDGCGNAAMAMYTTRVDGSSPTIICPVNVLVSCAAQVPAANTNAVITSDNCGTVAVTSMDVITNQTCPNRFTLTRTYTSTDPCGNATMCVQIITVNDLTLPLIVCPANITVSCPSQVPVADPASIIASDNCGPATVTFVSDVVTGMTCTNLFTITRTYQATDPCGNVSICTQIITVNDQTPPVFTVLPQNLEIECTEGGNYDVELNAWLANFGNAQVSDGCGAAFLTTVAVISESPWCGGNTLVRTYEFRATDACGNTSLARAAFTLADHTPPVIICPPGNVLLTCVHDIPAPNIADVIAYDNCGSVHVTVTISTVGTGCLGYPLTTDYWFMATDECGNMSNCDQSFQVIDSLPPLYSGPDTIEVGCVNDLPGSGEISSILAPYMTDNCSDIVCVGRVSMQNGTNSITYTVKAKDLCGNWTQRFNITFIATGVCKPLCTATQLTWGDPAGVINGMTTTAAIEQFIAEHGGVTAGKLGKTITATSVPCVLAMLPGSGTTAQFSPPGKHTFGAANNCDPTSPLLNNNGTLKNKLAANVMALQFNIWYNQAFNQRSLGVQQLAGLPACLVDPIVLEKMETDQVTVQGLLNLSNSYLAGVGFYPPGFGELINDALENLNNYWQNCQISDPCLTNATVAGALKTELQSGLEEVTINLIGSHPTHPPMSMFALTDAQGTYSFLNAVPQSSNLTVIPMKDDNPLNGVTTYDLALISKHILGLEPLSSPYKMIAADVNKSGSITAFDIVELRKLILGIYEELPNNTSWRFVDKSFVFPTTANPFQTDFPENITRANIISSEWNDDFVAVKVGDVNQSAIANAQQGADERTSGTLLLDVDFAPGSSTQRKENNGIVKAGETFELTFKTAEEAQGFQFTLNLDGLSVVEIIGNEKVNAENFGVFLPTGAGTEESGALTVSVDGAQEFTVRFRATKTDRISNMLSVSSRITKAEGYLTEGTTITVKEVALRFHENGTSVIAGVDFELYQNQPNPFQNHTVIGFYLPTAASATLTVYDDAGRTIFTQQGDFAKGYNSIPVALSMLNNSSMLYYKLQTATNVAMKKMIQVK